MDENRAQEAQRKGLSECDTGEDGSTKPLAAEKSVSAESRLRCRLRGSGKARRSGPTEIEIGIETTSGALRPPCFACPSGHLAGMLSTNLTVAAPLARRNSTLELLLRDSWIDPEILLRIFSFVPLTVSDIIETYRLGAVQHHSAVLHELSFRMVASMPSRRLKYSLDGFSALLRTVQSREFTLNSLPDLDGFVGVCETTAPPVLPEPIIQEHSYYEEQLEDIAVFRHKKRKYRRRTRRRKRKLRKLGHPMASGIEDEISYFRKCTTIGMSEISLFPLPSRPRGHFDPRSWGVRPLPFRYLRSLVVSFRISDAGLQRFVRRSFANPQRFQNLQEISFENCSSLRTFEGLVPLLTYRTVPSTACLRIHTLGLSWILPHDDVSPGSLTTILGSTIPGNSSGLTTHLQSMRFLRVDFSILGWDAVFKSGRLRMILFNDCWNLNYILRALEGCVTHKLIVRNSYPLHARKSWEVQGARDVFYDRLGRILSHPLRVLQLHHVDESGLTDGSLRRLYDSGLRQNESLEELQLTGRNRLTERSVGIMKELLSTHLKLRRVTFFTKQTSLRTEESRCVGELVKCVDPRRHDRVRIVPVFRGVNKDDYRKKYLMALRLRMLNRQVDFEPTSQKKQSYVNSSVRVIRKRTKVSTAVAREMLRRCSGDLVTAVLATRARLDHERSGSSSEDRKPVEGEYTSDMDMALLEGVGIPTAEEERRLRYLEDESDSWPKLHDGPR